MLPHQQPVLEDLGQLYHRVARVAEDSSSNQVKQLAHQVDFSNNQVRHQVRPDYSRQHLAKDKLPQVKEAYSTHRTHLLAPASSVNQACLHHRLKDKVCSNLKEDKQEEYLVLDRRYPRWCQLRQPQVEVHSVQRFSSLVSHCSGQRRRAKQLMTAYSAEVRLTNSISFPV